MIPSAWQLALLSLGVYRVWRIIGLDDMPGLVAMRNWLAGASELAGVWSFRRRWVADLLQCPWCSGWWLSLSAAAVWFVDARAALLIAVPFALATLVGALGHFLNG